MRRLLVIASLIGVATWVTCRHRDEAPHDACNSGCGLLIIQPLPIGNDGGQSDPLTVVSDDGRIECSNKPSGPQRCVATYDGNEHVVLRFADPPEDWQWYSSCGTPLNVDINYAFNFWGDRILKVWTGK